MMFAMSFNATARRTIPIALVFALLPHGPIDDFTRN